MTVCWVPKRLFWEKSTSPIRNASFGWGRGGSRRIGGCSRWSDDFSRRSGWRQGRRQWEWEVGGRIRFLCVPQSRSRFGPRRPQGRSIGGLPTPESLVACVRTWMLLRIRQASAASTRRCQSNISVAARLFRGGCPSGWRAVTPCLRPLHSAASTAAAPPAPAPSYASGCLAPPHR